MLKIPNARLMTLLESRVKVLTVSSVTSWGALMSDQRFLNEKELERYIIQKNAREVGQKFAESLVESGRFSAHFERDSILDGLRCRLSVVPMTTDQLISLVHEAYDLGRTNPVAVISPPQLA